MQIHIHFGRHQPSWHTGRGCLVPRLPGTMCTAAEPSPVGLPFSRNPVYASTGLRQHRTPPSRRYECVALIWSSRPPRYGFIRPVGDYAAGPACLPAVPVRFDGGEARTARGRGLGFVVPSRAGTLPRSRLAPHPTPPRRVVFFIWMT